ncbi:MAG TPA: tetratricopeptide repeat protein, partial [Chloroflexota bacterium]
QFGERWETSDQATPLVGRDREMVELLDLWIRAQGGDGQVATLIGDAGVGKSRLISEVLEKVGTSIAIRVIRARCLSYGQEIPLWLVADLLRSFLGVAEQDTLDVVRHKLSVTTTGLLAEAGVEIQAEATDVLGEVLGLPPGKSLVTNAGAQIRRQALIRDIRLLLGALSDRAPTIVVLEDLHWIDDASADVLVEVLADIPGLRVLVMAAQRPGWTAPWSEWGWTERLTLRPLRDDEAALMAGAVLGGMKPSPELEQYVADRAGGNPFFLEEMLRTLIETGGLAQRNGSMHLVPGAAERLPSTLTEVLLARLDRLDVQVRGVAQVASVIGRSFAVKLLAEVMGREPAALEAPLTALQRAEIAFPRRGSDVEYVFKHVSLREVAYNTLVHRRRQELHLATARAIAQLYPSDEYVEMIAYHYGHTEEHIEAAEWLERAGDRAAGIYANEAAIAQYQEARRRLVLSGGDETALARLDEKVGAVLATVGRYDEALELFDHAVEIYRQARNFEAVGRITARMGRVHRIKGTIEQGISRLQPILDVLASSGPSRGLALLHVALAHLLFANGRYRECLEASVKGAELARAVGDDAILAAAEMRRAAGLELLGCTEEGIRVGEDAIPLAEGAGDLDTLSILVSNLGEGYFRTGALEQGRKYLERALELAERVGEIASTGYTMVTLGEVLLYLGLWEDARQRIERGAEMLQSVGDSWYAAYPLLHLGHLELLEGRRQLAREHLNSCLAIADGTGDSQAQRYVHWLLGRLEIWDGMPEACLERIEPLISEEGPYTLNLLATLGEAYLDLGAVDRAFDLVQQALTGPQGEDQLLYTVEGLLIKGRTLTRQGHHTEAAAAFDECLSAAQSMPYPYIVARVLFEWGLLNREQGQHDRARERLAESLAIFRRLGAAHDIERVEETLAKPA